MKAFEELSSLLDQIPPVDQDLRYGNRAYQTWYDEMVAKAQSMNECIVGKSHLYPSVVELKQYWIESFGNRTRIDYGTGSR